jgi:hypothetical protein
MESENKQRQIQGFVHFVQDDEPGVVAAETGVVFLAG